MQIVSEWGLDVQAESGGTSVVYLHLDHPCTLSAQVAIGAFGSAEGPYIEVGFSAFAQNFGPAQQIGSDVGGSLDRWFFRDSVTDLWMTARSDDSFVAASARVCEWR